jgi:hypothetical protein
LLLQEGFCSPEFSAVPESPPEFAPVLRSYPEYPASADT